jgi:ubiquinone/menaquinone biosynthesis C-methylase UbiE
MTKKSTGERLEFYDFSDVTVEHLHRYAIANDFIEGKVVLDIASGEGYGSNILAQKALEVIGVDIDIDSVKDANEKYIKNNLKYIVGSADNIPIESNSIDVVVSFETIEHHDKHEEMFMEIKRVLKQDGILIMSSPDKKHYSDIPNFKNKFHVKELYFEDFEFLTKKYFKKPKFYMQKAYNMNSIVSNIFDFNNMIIYSGDHFGIKKNENAHLYILVVASENDLKDLNTSIFNGIDINNIKMEQHLMTNSNKIKNEIKLSNSYRLGNIVIKPLFVLKKLFKSKFHNN